MKQLQKLFHMLETVLLVSLFIALLATATGQIILRNFFNEGITWADPLMRHLVLWLTFVGAMVASRTNHHIKIDLFAQVFKPKIKRIIARITMLFTALVAFVGAYYCFSLVKMEFEFSSMAFANIPVWALQSIMPFAFMVIGLRYFTGTFIWKDELK